MFHKLSNRRLPKLAFCPELSWAWSQAGWAERVSNNEHVTIVKGLGNSADRMRSIQPSKGGPFEEGLCSGWILEDASDKGSIQSSMEKDRGFSSL